SAVSDTLERGCAGIPALRFTDVSSPRSGMPNAFVTRLWLLLVRTRLRIRLPLASMANWLLTLLNHTWPREGARNPVLAAPRTATRGATSRREATFQLNVRPKSL